MVTQFGLSLALPRTTTSYPAYSNCTVSTPASGRDVTRVFRASGPTTFESGGISSGSESASLLYVAAGLDEPHGLAIKGELEQYYEKENHHGRLYPNLDTLVDKGLIEKGQADRRTDVYSATRCGTREIEARRDCEDQYVDDLPAA